MTYGAAKSFSYWSPFLISIWPQLILIWSVPLWLFLKHLMHKSIAMRRNGSECRRTQRGKCTWFSFLRFISSSHIYVTFQADSSLQASQNAFYRPTLLVGKHSATGKLPNEQDPSCLQKLHIYYIEYFNRKPEILNG
jgi:hypothetical protein